MAEKSNVWIDFDGTISRQDVLDELINRFATNESWKLVEQRWQAGLIGSRECLSQELGLIEVGPRELEGFLDQIQLDPGIYDLLALLKQMKVPVTILSDGIDRFIRRILARHGLKHIPLRANRVVHRRSALRLACPFSADQCQSAAAHCKCSSIQALQTLKSQSIYIGDGRSDLCPARTAAVVFAKGALAKALAKEHIAYYPYVTLKDVAAALQSVWQPKVAAI